ncbi:CASP-like protein 1 [Heracleum sosnowskyi]|uniref:CASP-like protein n=1 Tax=Heracleum sosnowskyi TaxID=360622 RepID=A0AAD8N3E4_9APIA|nr:CASP-like protein 1 [Heracleum sosnowskyi]
MASTDKPEVENVAAAPEKGAVPPAAPPPELKSETNTPTSYLAVAEVVLRVLLFATTVTAVVVMVTSKQTEWIPDRLPPFRIRNSSRFTDSPAFVYFVAALSVAGLYSIISTLLSILALLKPGNWKHLVSHFVVIDVLLLGIVASATGVAGGVAYIGLKGNSHSRWLKICNIYDTFCAHVASATAVALVASIVLVLLILLSVFTLSRRSLK